MSSATSTDPGLRPWQLFVLAGMLAATGVVLVSTGRPMSSIIVLSITVVAASLVAIATFQVVGPLLGVASGAEETTVEGRARLALEREKALVLRSIKEVEFDHAMRKTATADYEEMRQRLRSRAVGLMQQLDASGYRATVEQDLAQRLAASTGSGASLEPAAAGVVAPPVAQCAACGTSNDPDARFCKQCGVSLTRSM